MYFSRLDTIRFYAVFAVIFAHIFKIWTWDTKTVFLAPMGNVGVIVFFVLSGFLITNILLSKSSQINFTTRLKNFYWRRSLRIFPIYYLYLIVMFSFNLGEIREAGLYPWFYLTNIYIFKHDTWIEFNSPLWTLSIEEQFYIFWPFLVLFLKDNVKLLSYSFGLIIVIALIARLYLFYNAYSLSPQVEVFTLTNLDSLALGGVLALLYKKYDQQLFRYGVPLIIFSLIIHYLSLWLKFSYGVEFLYWSIGKFAVSTMAAGFIIYAIFAKDKYGIFHNPVTVYLGKISYGLYLYHNIMVYHYVKITGFFGMTVSPDNILARIAWPLFFTILVAQISFMIIERPFIKLKKGFQ